MAVRIRMKRLGRRHRPFFRICVIDGRKPRNGKAIEEIGHYDPMVPDKSKRVTINMERVDYWISVGAQPSENVATLIKKIKANDFGTAKAPAPMTEPKPLPEPEPEKTEDPAAESSEEEAAEETTTEDSPAEEKEEATAS